MLYPNETIVWIWKLQSEVQDPGEETKLSTPVYEEFVPLGNRVT